jgi:hypothetical protein
MTEPPSDALEQARIKARLSHSELWLRYFALGGLATPIELEAYLYGSLRPPAHEHDVLAHAINERFVELGGDHPVPYSHD